MLKFVKKNKPKEVVMLEDDNGELIILDEELKRNEKECQTKSKSTE